MSPPKDVDFMASLLHAAQLAVDAATSALRTGELAEPHLRAARYFLDRASDRVEPKNSVEAEEATAEVLALRAAMRTDAVVEQAKGILMLKLGLEENDAHERLVKLARRGHVEVVDVARAIVAQAVNGPTHRRRYH